MTSNTILRRGAGFILAAAVLASLAGCQVLARDSIDTQSIAEAVTATSDSIASTLVETSTDGLTTRLWVAPIITDELTSAQLDALLQVAYEESKGRVSTIEISPLDANENSVDISNAASGLGIQYDGSQGSAKYSTQYLDEAYGG